MTPCLLSTANRRIVGGVSIGERIARAGKRALWNARPSVAVDTIVIHHISALDDEPGRPFDDNAILAVFCTRLVSAHYLILRDGQVLQLVPEDQRAWHAGGSIMPAPDRRRNVNDFSVGIELVATPTSGYTEEQYEAADILCRELRLRLGAQTAMVGHDEIAGAEAVSLGLRTDVKTDPGPLFDWARLGRPLAGR